MAKRAVSMGMLTVPGEGRVTAKPDVAQLRLGVLTEAKTAREAARMNAQKMTAVVDAMLALGIKEDAMKTVGLNIYPVMQFDEAKGRNEIVGFRAENTILVEMPVERAGEAFDAAVAAGANESSNISFAVKDEAPLRTMALEAAVASAQADAEVVTKAMGVDLRSVKSIDVEQGGNRAVLYSTARFEKAASTPVLGGEVTVTARVTVVFEYAN